MDDFESALNELGTIETGAADVISISPTESAPDDKDVQFIGTTTSTNGDYSKRHTKESTSSNKMSLNEYLNQNHNRPAQPAVSLQLKNPTTITKSVSMINPSLANNRQKLFPKMPDLPPPIRVDQRSMLGNVFSSGKQENGIVRLASVSSANTVIQPNFQSASQMAGMYGAGAPLVGSTMYYQSAAPQAAADSDAFEEQELGHSETFHDYMPSKVKYGYQHPDPVVESSSLASVEPADVTYNLNLPCTVVENRQLSALQLESITYACQRHDRCSSSEETYGFLIGDGAGVGKGRTIAGIIYENYLRGRKRAVWFSVSNDLKVDATRDFCDLGIGREMPVFLLSKMKYAKIEVKQGVLFSTYSSLIGESQTKSGRYGTRLKQLVQWCGEDFNGVIVFDECHRAKNLMTDGAKKGTKTGKAVVDLQKALPKARIVYSSATGASEPKNMAYMVRLGLWGPGTAFNTFQEFASTVEKRGVGAMEMVAMDIKRRGMYIARQLSFKGVRFRVEDVALDAKFTEVYDRCVDLWCHANRVYLKAIEIIENETGKKCRRGMSHFWGSHQRFFKYMCMSAKVGLCCRLAKNAVREGKCVLIGLQSTGEARTLEALEDKGGQLDEFVSTASAVFTSLVEKHFPGCPKMKTNSGAIGGLPKPPVTSIRLNDNGGSVKRARFEKDEVMPIGGDDPEMGDVDATVVKVGVDEAGDDIETAVTKETRGRRKKVNTDLPWLVGSDESSEETPGTTSTEDDNDDYNPFEKNSGKLPWMLDKPIKKESKPIVPVTVVSRNANPQPILKKVETGAPKPVAAPTLVIKLPPKAEPKPPPASDDNEGEDDEDDSKPMVIVSAVHTSRKNPANTAARRNKKQVLDKDLMDGVCSDGLSASDTNEDEEWDDVGAKPVTGPLPVPSSRRKATTNRTHPWPDCGTAKITTARRIEKDLPSSEESSLIDIDSSGDDDDELVAKKGRGKKPGAGGASKNGGRARKRKSEFGDDFSGDSDDDFAVSDLSPQLVARLQTLQSDLHAEISKLVGNLPSNTLDALIDGLGGPTKVAEMTGRKGRVVDAGPSGGGVRYESRVDGDATLETLNLAEKKAFMDGRKLMAIISEAASSGISLQADRRVVNTRQRVHITMELPWSADRAIQQFGRSHRSNQVCPPEYVFLISKLAGEQRFAATVAKRLESLGALTHGDRRATEAQDLSQFNFENKYGRQALEIVLKSICVNAQRYAPAPEWYSGDFFADARQAFSAVGLASTIAEPSRNETIARFLNRILGIRVDLQNAVFEYFSSTLKATILEAKRMGRWDLGILDIGGSGESVQLITRKDFTVKGVSENDHDQTYNVSLYHVRVNRGLDFKSACAMLNNKNHVNAQDDKEGFYLSTNKRNQNILAMLVLATTRAASGEGRGVDDQKLYQTYRPNLGSSARLETWASLKSKYRLTTAGEARQYWNHQYQHSESQCIHQYLFRKCTNQASCEMGLRQRSYFILAGSVLSIWGKLEQILSNSVTAQVKLQMVRLHLPNESKVVGCLIPSSACHRLETELSKDFECQTVNGTVNSGDPCPENIVDLCSTDSEDEEFGKMM